MRRREFIALLGGATAWPLSAQAQRAGMAVIGVLQAGSPDDDINRMLQFRKGLAETGYVEGENVQIEYRWARNDYNQLPLMAAELVRRSVDVLYSAGGAPTALAASAATSTIPVVFQFSADPVEIGIVSSLNRPGGNITGVAAFSRELTAKRLEILRELIPSISTVGYLNDPTTQVAENRRKAFEAAAIAIGLKSSIARAGSARELEEVFAKLAHDNISGIVVQGSPRFVNYRDTIVQLAAQYRIAAIYEQPENTRGGGLISYGSSILEANRLGGTYVGRILKGEKPANMPVMLPTKFDLVINLKTAKALGLNVPPTLLARADEVIE